MCCGPALNGCLRFIHFELIMFDEKGNAESTCTQLSIGGRGGHSKYLSKRERLKKKKRRGTFGRQSWASSNSGSVQQHRVHMPFGAN